MWKRFLRWRLARMANQLLKIHTSCYKNLQEMRARVDEVRCANQALIERGTPVPSVQEALDTLEQQLIVGEASFCDRLGESIEWLSQVKTTVTHWDTTEKTA